MKIAMIAAMDRNRLIGVDNGLPWRLPADMAWFKQVTMGKPVVMGRKTYESIPLKFRPLPGRLNIVLTRNKRYEAAGAIVVHTIEEALAAAASAETHDEVIIGGGGQLYGTFLPQATRLYLTLVEAILVGDAHFPAWEAAQWREVAREWHGVDERHPYAFSWVTLERI